LGDLLGYLNIRYRRVVENAMTMRNFSFMLAGALIGTAFAMFMQHRPVPATCDEVAQKIDVYRLCMQSASRTRCSMQVEDFADFHELKRTLALCSRRDELKRQLQ
jgi:hypothetical protein